jgi:hypothetical protein
MRVGRITVTSYQTRQILALSNPADDPRWIPSADRRWAWLPRGRAT